MNIRTKFDSAVAINTEIRKALQNLTRLRGDLEYEGKRNTEAYELICEYQTKLTTMHNDLLDSVS